MVSRRKRAAASEAERVETATGIVAAWETAVGSVVIYELLSKIDERILLQQ